MRIVDIHSHIIPGVDDGSADNAESLEMLRIAESEGITDLFATPHYQSGRFYTPPHVMEEKIARLQREAEKADLHIRLHTGTEIYYRSDLEERLDTGELATMNGTEYVLVEFSPREDFHYIRNAIDDIRGMGYRPILAHVERYQCMLGHEDRVRELRGMGCAIQANAGSIAGDFGFLVKRFLQKLLKEELIDFIGTDAHNSEGRSPKMKKCLAVLQKKCDGEYIERLLYGNAEQYLMCGR